MTSRILLPALCLFAAALNSYGQKPRIIGGEDAAAGEYPWMAGLLVKAQPDTFLAQDCGGALIHPYWIVTAAHCVEFRNPADMQVVVGATDLTEAGLVRRNVAEVIMHPDYRPWSNDHDIALVLLEEPVTGIEPLEIINDPALAAPAVAGLALGWGAADATDDPAYPETLQAVELPIIDSEIANQADWLDGGVTPNMFAAGYEDGGKDTCGGDSGGPFVVRGPAGQWMLAGVINWGEGCAVAKKPGVLCRVSRYRQWLQSIVWPNFYQWETAAGISTDDGPDVDGDGASQWLEYALRRDPRETDSGILFPGTTQFENLLHPTLTVKRPLGGGDISWGLQGSANLAAWSTLDPLLQLTAPPAAIPNDPASELVTWRGLPGSEGRSFMRAIIKPSGKYLTAARTLAYPGFVQHALHTLETPVSDFYTRDYELTTLVTGKSTILTLRSENFDPVLQLVNTTTGAVLQSSTANSGGGSDERITFTPAAGNRYTARVTTTTAGETGAYDLSIFDGSPTTIAAGITRTGSLSSADPRDELEPNLVLYKDDYLFRPAASTVITFTQSSSAYAPLISIVDAETGGLVNFSFGYQGIGTAMISWKPEANHYYYIRASSGAERDTGNYTLRATSTANIAIGGTANGILAGTDGLDPFYTAEEVPLLYYIDDYALTGTAGGELLTITMSAAAFASTIEVLNAVTGESINYDYTDTAGTAASLQFNTVSGVSYIIRASTYDEEETGAYTLSVSGG